MKPISPWAYQTPFAIALQQSLIVHDPELADQLVELAGGAGAGASLLLAGEQAKLLAEGKEDTLQNYSLEAQAVLSELRPGSAHLARQAEVQGVIAELDQRATASQASRPEREEARRAAELAGRQASQRAAEQALQAGQQLGG